MKKTKNTYTALLNRLLYYARVSSWSGHRIDADDQSEYDRDDPLPGAG